ncbi:MAG: hypothetical protein A2539_01460 [Elusimicrobia bacterium RIFOXYD2_FULL_34_15]|nr:MAG: hypothetical protein A2539_01460 [Elusimicrobia bacterium RIFOXYD2_FULL_34_15]
MKKIIPIIILALFAGCSTIRSTAKKYDTRLTTVVHHQTAAYTYRKLDDIYNIARWAQPYAGDYIDSDFYYMENWLRFRTSPKINGTLYTRTDPFTHNQGNNQMYGRKTIAFDLGYDVTSDFQIQTGVTQHNYEYDGYSAPWTAESLRDDFGQLSAINKLEYKRTDNEIRAGFTLRKQYSNISARITSGNVSYLYTALDQLPDANLWARPYEGSYYKTDYLIADMRWQFNVSPKFRGELTGALTPDINTTSQYNQYYYNRLGLTTFYRLNPNWEFQIGVSHQNYMFGARNPYNPPSWIYTLQEPTYSTLINNLNFERKRTIDDVWVGFELRP